MQTQLGINYTSHGGIFLGGTSTAGTTEAEICWNCHKDVGGVDSYGVSEWGYNSVTTGTFPAIRITPTNGDAVGNSYNYGWIFTSSARTTKTPDWTGGGTAPYWISAYEPTLTMRVTSVHTVALDCSAGQISSVAANLTCNVADNCAVNFTAPTVENRRGTSGVTTATTCTA